MVGVSPSTLKTYAQELRTELHAMFESLDLSQWRDLQGYATRLKPIFEASPIAALEVLAVAHRNAQELCPGLYTDLERLRHAPRPAEDQATLRSQPPEYTAAYWGDMLQLGYRAWTSDLRDMVYSWEDFKKLMLFVDELDLDEDYWAFITAAAAHYAWGIQRMTDYAKSRRRAIAELVTLVAQSPWLQPAWRAAAMLDQCDPALVADELTRVSPDNVLDCERFEVLRQQITHRSTKAYLLRLRSDATVERQVRNEAAEALQHLASR